MDVSSIRSVYLLRLPTHTHAHISPCEVTWVTNFSCKEVVTAGYTVASAVCFICNLATQEGFLPHRVAAQTHKEKRVLLGYFVMT